MDGRKSSEKSGGRVLCSRQQSLLGNNETATLPYFAITLHIRVCSGLDRRKGQDQNRIYSKSQRQRVQFACPVVSSRGCPERPWCWDSPALLVCPTSRARTLCSLVLLALVSLCRGRARQCPAIVECGADMRLRPDRLVAPPQLVEWPPVPSLASAATAAGSAVTAMLQPGEEPGML